MIITYKTEHEVHVKSGGKLFRFWILGEGLIPLHKNPTLWEDRPIRRFLKQELFK